MNLYRLLFFFLFTLPLWGNESIDESTKKSVVKIIVTANEPDYSIPWQSKEPTTSKGSGVLIQGNYILTCAHVALHASYVSIQKYDEVKKYPAKIKWISNEIDLALLEVDDKEFYEEMTPVKIGPMPKRGDAVYTLGYPEGGDDLSLTKGVVSRIEERDYTHGFSKALAIQIDAAINSGNSGGPALNNNNEIVGIAMQGLKDANNIGYIVPSIWIEHFLKDIKDNKFDGLPRVRIAVNRLENQAIRDFYHMGKRTGVIVEHIANHKDNYPLKVGDVILAIDGISVQNDKSIRTTFGKVDFSYQIRQKQVGENVTLTIYREQKELDIIVNADVRKSLVKNVFDAKAKYFIYGGIVFMPVTFNFRRANEKEMPGYFYNRAMDVYNSPLEEQEELIAIRMILPHAVNSGYEDSIQLVQILNAKKPKNFIEFVNTLKSYDGKYITIETSETTMVLDTVEVKKANAEILENYRIEADGVY
jgi:S1-C subfamily serine protease